MDQLKFKVYNGKDIPLCKCCEIEGNVNSVCTWLSDQYCFSHALEYVRSWDSKNRVVNDYE